MPSLHLSASLSLPQMLVIAAAVCLVAGIDIRRRLRGKHTHLLFACVIGTLLSMALLIGSKVFIGTNGQYANSHMVALGAVMLVLAWKALFGPWEAETKAGVLGTFLFWIIFTILSCESQADRNVHLLALAVALIPAGVWCGLFLKYHRERVANVLLMFFAGMLSTLPILFYDALVRKGVELQFFLFRVTPESFNHTSQGFVGQLGGVSGMQSALMTSLVSFVIVAVIEEGSKYWVVSRSGKQLFTSIDDVLELSIIAAIGFAFAENIVNPSYFAAFIREYLFGPQRDILAFVSNVMGRSVLTSMMHILSTGVMGYFLGLAIFAGPYLEERHSKGRSYRFLVAMHRLLHLREISVFRVQMLMTGFVLAVVFHALFNFMVTVPDLLPMQPQTIGELFGSKVPAFLGGVPLLLLPSVLYVVGGFWLLTSLFLRKESMEERGHLITTETFVAQAAEEL